MQQGLAPGVQHGKETDLGSEVLGIGRDGTESFCCRPEENGVDEFLILKCHRSHLFGER